MGNDIHKGTDRYSRQIIYENIGAAGQEKISKASIAIIGLGALGSAVSLQLSRAGVGNIKLIDYDQCELSDLHRQILYDESDAILSKYKANAAYEHLSAGNNAIHFTAVKEKICRENITAIVRDSQLIIDGTDNFETRQVIGEYCYDNEIPWIYGGVLGSRGMTYNFLPGGGPCFECVFGDTPPKRKEISTYDTGVINMITGLVASIQSTEAIKIIVEDKNISKKLRVADLWHNEFESFLPSTKPLCPLCGNGVS